GGREARLVESLREPAKPQAASSPARDQEPHHDRRTAARPHARPRADERLPLLGGAVRRRVAGGLRPAGGGPGRPAAAGPRPRRPRRRPRPAPPRPGGARAAAPPRRGLPQRARGRGPPGAAEPARARERAGRGPGRLTGYIAYSDRVLWQLWARLADAVREGTPRWKQAFGLDGPIFASFFRTEDDKREFLWGMHGYGQISSPEVVS